MAIGTNLTAVTGSGMEDIICDKLGIKSLRDLGAGGKMYTAAAAPTDDGTTDDPLSVGAFCIDLSTGDVYICFAWAASNNHEWVKIGETT